MSVYVKSLHIYPLKGAAALDLVEATVTPRGLAFGRIEDRCWMLVDSNGKFLTQRSKNLNIMATLKPQANEDYSAVRYVFGAESSPWLNPAALSDKDTLVTIWSDKVKARVAIDAVNEWFSKALKTDVQLVFQPADYIRNCDPYYTQNHPGGAVVGFADGFPILITNQDTLDGLAILKRPPMRQFRPNVVIAGGGKNFEYDHDSLSFNGTRFDLDKFCTRCVVTTTDQQNGELNAWPDHMKALIKEYFIRHARPDGKFDQGAVFGMNAIGTCGQIRVGDTLVAAQPRVVPLQFLKRLIQ